jgi:two-component system response regulator HydG
MNPFHAARRLAAELKEQPRLAAMVEQLARRLHDEEALNEDDPARLLEAAMGAFLGITGAERGFAALRRGDQIGILAARNFRPEALSGSSLWTTRGCLEEALRTGRAVREGTRDLNPLSALAIPLRAEGDVLGAVYLEKSSTAGAFGEEEERDALDFAARVGGPLKRAILLDEVRRTLPASPLRSIVGHSPALCRAVETLEKVAPTDAPVLLLGESGTGKELFARALHELSPRRGKPCVAINCAAVPETLLESDLFGHVRGAFTGATADAPGKFEAAHGGTLFLDEVAEMSPGLQAKLLRALQGGEIQPVGAPRSRRVDTRIVCATNRRLEDLVAGGKFREDLYYRLNVVAIRIPALRERREDLPILIRHFLVRFASQQKKNLTGFDRPALALLLNTDYPGNVRELENVIRHAVLMSGGPVIGPHDLPEYLRPHNPAESLLDVPRTAAELRQMKRRVREDVEKSFVIEALKRSGGSITRAAAETGVHRTRLAQLISRHKIDSSSYKNIT